MPEELATHSHAFGECDVHSQDECAGGCES